ncbi:hypothetical protein [Maridesulfovibrio zosterae]|uniref:hypothetical protein n=1 Tax=Maridesulfovibrio zosterae TaxID=82171 RepID=UPI0003F53239|nr:hypothetical protein [Maridesulfovibrio zosterae]
MNKIKLIALCMALLFILGGAGCGFKNAESAKSSMQDVNQCAEGLKDDSQSSKEKTEKIKETEAQNSTQGYQW